MWQLRGEGAVTERRSVVVQDREEQETYPHHHGVVLRGRTRRHRVFLSLPSLSPRFSHGIVGAHVEVSQCLV
jgi:hypothetical protein